VKQFFNVLPTLKFVPAPLIGTSPQERWSNLPHLCFWKWVFSLDVVLVTASYKGLKHEQGTEIFCNSSADDC